MLSSGMSKLGLYFLSSDIFEDLVSNYLFESKRFKLIWDLLVGLFNLKDWFSSEPLSLFSSSSSSLLTLIFHSNS
jgi:hypothetical protein